MRAQLVVAVVVETLNGRVLDGSVLRLDLPVGPGMVGFRQPVLHPASPWFLEPVAQPWLDLADHVEAHRPRADGSPVPGLLRDLNAVVGQAAVDPAGHGLKHVLTELPGSLSICGGNEVSDGEHGRPVESHEEKELALGSLHLGNVDVEEADGVALELLPPGLVAFHIRQK